MLAVQIAMLKEYLAGHTHPTYQRLKLHFYTQLIKMSGNPELLLTKPFPVFCHLFHWTCLSELLSVGVLVTALFTPIQGKLLSVFMLKRGNLKVWVPPGKHMATSICPMLIDVQPLGYSHFNTQSWNPGMVWVGKDLKDRLILSCNRF